MTDDLSPPDASSGSLRKTGVGHPGESPTRLYGLLSPEARALYELVPGAQELFRPTVASRGALRRGFRQDDAFRNLLRAAMDESARPRGWRREEWSDEEVARAAADPQLLSTARTISKSAAPNGWKATWKRRRQRETAVLATFTYCFAAVTFSLATGIPWFALAGVAGILATVVYLKRRQHLDDRSGPEPHSSVGGDSTPPSEGGVDQPLFVVERAPSQHLIARGTGLVIVAVAVILAVTEIVQGGRLALVGVTMWLSTLGVLGAVIFVWALSVGRARIVGFDDHLVVRPGLRRSRVVAASEIASLSWLSGGRLRGADARGRTLFTVMSVYDDFPDLVAWLEARVSQGWADRA